MKDGKPWRVRRAERLAAEAAKGRTGGPRAVPENHNPHAPRGIKPWEPEKLFAGKIVCVIGGGPTLKEQVWKDALQKTKGLPCIVVNNSYEIAPWADILHFADCIWWEWNGEQVKTGWPKDKIMSTATSDVAKVNDTACERHVYRWWRDRNRFTEDRKKLHGWDGGTQAIHLAYHLGARRIVLFGIDMMPGKKGETQWHNKHKRKTRKENYEKRFLPSLKRMIPELQKRGCEVIRVTPGAELPGVKTLPVDEALELGYGGSDPAGALPCQPPKSSYPDPAPIETEPSSETPQPDTMAMSPCKIPTAPIGASTTPTAETAAENSSRGQPGTMIDSFW